MPGSGRHTALLAVAAITPMPHASVPMDGCAARAAVCAWSAVCQMPVKGGGWHWHWGVSRMRPVQQRSGTAR